MADARLRRLARAASRDDDPVARGALLRERARLGEVTEEGLRLASYLGDAGAREALSGDLPDEPAARAELATRWQLGLDDIVERHWQAALESSARPVQSAILTAALAAPPLRRLFVGTSQDEVVFSRCARYPTTSEVTISPFEDVIIVHVRDRVVLETDSPAEAARAAAAVAASGCEDRWLGRRQDWPLDVARLGGPWPLPRLDDLLVGLAVFGRETCLRAGLAVAHAACKEWLLQVPGEPRVSAAIVALVAYLDDPGPETRDACLKRAEAARRAAVAEEAVRRGQGAGGVAWVEAQRVAGLARTVATAAEQVKDERARSDLRLPGLSDAVLRSALLDDLLGWSLDVAEPGAIATID
jgi:hypothetical protein